MPQAAFPDQKNKSRDTSIYECLRCGNITKSERHPGTCDCGGGFQNRAKSLE